MANLLHHACIHFFGFGVGTWSEYGNQSDNEYTYGTQNQSKYGPSDNKKKTKQSAVL